MREPHGTSLPACVGSFFCTSPNPAHLRQPRDDVLLNTNRRWPQPGGESAQPHPTLVNILSCPGRRDAGARPPRVYSNTQNREDASHIRQM